MKKAEGNYRPGGGTPVKRIFRKIHLWPAVPFGLIVTLICLSGATLVFEDEVMRLAHPDLFFASRSEGPRISVDEAARRVAAGLPEGVEVTGVSIPADKRCNWQVNLSRPRRSWIAIDPYTGEVKGRYERAPFFTTMFRLHRWLLDSARPGEGIFWGKLLVGTSTLLFVIALLSGVVLWWPRSRQALRHRLAIPLHKGRPRFWHGLHVAGGMYALLFLLLMALTGLTWSFGWYRSALYALLGIEAPASGGGSHGRPDKDGGQHKGKRAERAVADFTAWDAAYAQLAARHPDYRLITIGPGEASVSSAGWGNRRAADRYTFDRRTGHLLPATPYAQSSASAKARGWIFSLHVGSWAGLPGRILAFVAALLGASLPLTGYYLWLRRLRRQGNKPAP